MAMAKCCVVELSEQERDVLESLCKQGRVAAQKRRHAGILLLADEGVYGPSMTDVEVAEQMEVTTRCVENTRKRCVKQGLEEALKRTPRSREKSRALDGEAEARLVSLACSEAPKGHARWTLKLLSDKLVELEIVAGISPETVRQVLKKTSSNLGASRCGA